jgi:hypothetical protein
VIGEGGSCSSRISEIRWASACEDGAQARGNIDVVTDKNSGTAEDADAQKHEEEFQPEHGSLTSLSHDARRSVRAGVSASGQLRSMFERWTKRAAIGGGRLHQSKGGAQQECLEC